MKNCRFRKTRAKSILVSFLFLIQFISTAQISFKSSKMLFEETSSLTNTVIASDDSHIYLQRKTVLGEFFIDQFDHNLGLIQSKKMELTEVTERYNGISISRNINYGVQRNNDTEGLRFNEFYIAENGNLTFFFTFFQNGLLHLNKADLNKQTLSLDNETTIHTIDIGESNDYSGTFSKSFSPDSSKICIYSIHEWEKEDRILYLVFDRQYKLLNEGLHIFIRQDLDHELRTNCLIDNYGNCTFSITEKYGYSPYNGEKEEPDYHQLIQVNSKKSLLIETLRDGESSSKNRNIISMTSRITNDGLIICSGVYSNDLENTVDGVFSLSFSSDNLVLRHSKFNNLTRGQKEDFLISKNGSVHEFELKMDAKTRKKIKKDKELMLPESLELLKSVSGYGKSTYLVSTYIEKVTESGDYQDTYENGDFVIIKLDSLGKIEWITNIDRFERDLDPRFAFPVIEWERNGLNIFYMVWGKDQGLSRRIYCPISVQVGSNGKINMDRKNNPRLLDIGELFYVPVLGHKMSNTEFLVFGAPINEKGGKLVKFKMR